MSLFGPQNVPRAFIVNDYSSQSTDSKIKTFFPDLLSLAVILYEYHFRMDLKIFRTVDRKSNKSSNTSGALDAKYW